MTPFNPSLILLLYLRMPTYPVMRSLPQQQREGA
jgi:hypothetical protein